jgi:hypothetical protein
MTKNVKLEFRTVDKEGNVDVETPWAVSLGDDLYELDNIPFYAYGVSASDVVFATKDTEDGFPVFKKVVKKSGNKTVRIIFSPPVEDGNASAGILARLVEKGCTYEGMNAAYISVNIPPEIPLFDIRDFLEERALTWEHADPGTARCIRMPPDGFAGWKMY